MNAQEIKFVRTKDYKLIREINRGGFGKTVLLRDETIDEVFVCKKYDPYDEEANSLCICMISGRKYIL